MYIELLELLRCPSEHVDSSLVAAFSKVTNRFVDEATLGCPVCSQKFHIRNGVALFVAEPRVATPWKGFLSSYDREELATKAGGYLNAIEPGSTVLLGGLWAAGAQKLSELVDLRIFALNGPAGLIESAPVGLLAVKDRIPLAAGSCAGAAIDASFDDAIVPSIMRVVRAGGRIVGPVSFPPPATVLVLARDDSYWVARKAPDVTPLRRASR